MPGSLNLSGQRLKLDLHTAIVWYENPSPLFQCIGKRPCGMLLLVRRFLCDVSLGVGNLHCAMNVHSAVETDSVHHRCVQKGRKGILTLPIEAHCPITCCSRLSDSFCSEITAHDHCARSYAIIHRCVVNGHCSTMRAIKPQSGSYAANRFLSSVCLLHPS